MVSNNKTKLQVTTVENSKKQRTLAPRIAPPPRHPNNPKQLSEGNIGSKAKKDTPLANHVRNLSEGSLESRARKAAPNSAHLRLYEEGLKKQRQKNGLMK